MGLDAILETGREQIQRDIIRQRCIDINLGLLMKGDNTKEEDDLMEAVDSIYHTSMLNNDTKGFLQTKKIQYGKYNNS